MRTLHQTSVKNFYKWTILLCLCSLFVGAVPTPGGYAANIVNDFKMKLHQQLEELRALKTALMQREIKYKPSVSVRPLEVEGGSVTAGAVVRNGDMDMVFTVNFANILSRLENLKVTNIHRFPIHRSFISIQGFVHGNQTWLLAYHTNNRSRHFLKLYQYSSEDLKYKMRIPLLGPALVSTLKFGSKIHVAVASKNATSTELRFYQWTGTQLDEIYDSKLKVDYVGLKIFQMYGKVFVAVSSSGPNLLVIKRFFEYSAELKTIQVLETEAHSMKHFEIFDGHYLICADKTSIKIYRWSRYVFIKQQEVKSEKVVLDVVLHTLNKEILIAVVFKDEIQFLVQDVANRFVKAGNLPSPSQNFKSTIFYEEGQSKYMLPISSNNKNPLLVYDLSLQYKASAPEVDTNLKDCLESLDKKLDLRKVKINTITPVLDKLMLSTSHLQGKKLHVNGSIKSLGKTTIRSVELQMKFPSSSKVKKLKNNLTSAVEKMRNLAPCLIQRSKNQTLTGDFTFSNVNVKNEQNLFLTNHTILNNVTTKRLPFALKNKGDQIFLSESSVTKVESQRITTVFLNAIKLEDFLLLNTEALQFLTGHITFENATASDIFVNSGNLNDLAIQDIVLTTNSQKIQDTKKFSNLKVKSILTDESEINLEDMEKVVYVDSELINTTLYFMKNLTVLGDLNVTSMNGHALSLLWSDSVKKTESQSIYGHKTFKSLSFNGNLDVLGFINDLNSSNLMTLNTDQTIPGDVTFLNTLHFQQNLQTDSINNIDLRLEAINRNSEKIISVHGLKTFSSTLNVLNITLKDEVVIDNFDPSGELPQIIMRSSDDLNITDLYFNNPLTIGNVVVRNDVEIFEDSEEVPLLSLFHNVWLNTTEQNVSTLAVTNASIHELLVSEVNNIAIKDVVTVSGKGVINSAKNFSDLVWFKALKVEDGKTVNFTELWKSRMTIKIQGNVTVEDSVIEGDLNVIKGINGLDGFMTAEDYQTLNEEFEFENISLQDHFYGTELNIQYFNNSDFLDFLQHAVVENGGMQIDKKHFMKLKGATLLCEGSLNGILLSDVVTTNTMQKIPANIKFSSASFNKINVKQFFEGIRLDEVVYLDSFTKVSNKIFIEKVTTSYLTVSDYINGVNITALNTHAAKSHERNFFQEKITFMSYLQAQYIQVSRNFDVDGVKFEDLILLNETVWIKDYNGSTTDVKNITVKGLVNGCNITSVLQNALFFEKDSQIVTAKKTHMGSLTVDGNIYVEQMNGVYIQDIIEYLNRSSEFDFDSELIFGNVEMKYVQLKNTVNGQLLDRLIKDVVRIKVPQRITGEKTFANIDATKAIVKFLQVDTICESNVIQLFETSISKYSSNVTIEAKVLSTISANSAFFEGKINHLKLPDDVVLVNKSEFITTQTIINSTLNVSSNLEVIRKVDGIFLGRFLESRLTVNSSQNSSASLLFTRDVIINEMKIDGTVNKIKIDNIVNMGSDMTVNGSTNFSKRLDVEYNVQVNDTVNRTSFDNFNKQLLQVHQDGSIENSVIFSAINASALVCTTINDVVVRDFYNSTHVLAHSVNDRLDDLTSGILTQQQLLRTQKDTKEHMNSQFSYFELMHVLNLGLVQKFLPIYEFGVIGEKYELQVTGMVLWVEKTGDPCRKTLSLVTDVMKNGTFNVMKRLQGRIFPFSLRSAWGNVVGFYVQAEHTRRCLSSSKTIVVKTIFSFGDAEVNVIDAPTNSTLQEVLLLEVKEIFLLLAFSREDSGPRIIIYQYNTISSTWSIHQEFYSQGFNSLDLADVELPGNFLQIPDIYLAVAGDNNYPGVTIFKWDTEENKFAFKANFNTSASSYALWVKGDHILVLLLAKEKTRVRKEMTWENYYKEPLEVFSMHDAEIALNHTVHVHGVLYLETFVLGGDIFVLASSHHMNTLYILQYRGHNGFEVIQEIPSSSVTSTSLFSVENDLYLAISSSSTDQSRILKAAINGGRQILD